MASETGHYDIQYHFNDQLRGSTSLPNQREKPVDQYIRTPKADSYTKYSQYGFLYVQNLVANAVLR